MEVGSSFMSVLLKLETHPGSKKKNLEELYHPLNSFNAESRVR